MQQTPLDGTPQPHLRTPAPYGTSVIKGVLQIAITTRATNAILTSVGLSCVPIRAKTSLIDSKPALSESQTNPIVTVPTNQFNYHAKQIGDISTDFRFVQKCCVCADRCLAPFLNKEFPTKNTEST